jgi:hypothetical protein
MTPKFNKGNRMEITTKYSDHGNVEQELRDKQVHIITLAEFGKSVFRTYGEFVGNISDTVLRNYCDQANMIYGWTTLYPLMNLSAIARKYFRKELSAPEKMQFEKIIRGIFKLDTVFIKSKHLIFNFTCAVHNKDFFIQCIDSVAKEFEQTNSEIKVCEIWLDVEIFVG